jgi:hypothetical protein
MSACGHASGRKREARSGREASASGSLELLRRGWGPGAVRTDGPREETE